MNDVIEVVGLESVIPALRACDVLDNSEVELASPLRMRLEDGLSSGHATNGARHIVTLSDQVCNNRCRRERIGTGDECVRHFCCIVGALADPEVRFLCSANDESSSCWLLCPLMLITRLNLYA